MAKTAKKAAPVADAAESDDASASKPSRTVAAGRYLKAIERYEKAASTWKEQAEKITKIYLDQHRTAASARRFALLWSNIETLKPAVYARLPVAVVSRRFKDADPAGRKAAEVLERSINTTLDLYGVNDVLESVRDDRLIAARGTAWVRYDADVGEYSVEGEKACVDFVHWADFGHSVDRTWPEVKLVWRRVYLTKAKVKERFTPEIANKLGYEVREELKGRDDAADASEPQAVIYEIWDKDRQLAVWVSREKEFVLESGPPPLKLRNFWPCPKPVYGTKANRSLIPTPDYRYYQDQAEEIDDLTAKIAALQEWLVLKAFIPAGPSGEGGDAIVKLLQSLTEKLQSKGIFVPVESWAGFAEKGGSRLIDWLPMDMVVETIKAAVELRAQLVQDVYQVTGISDILRGETDPNETLGAQQLKAQTGSRRTSTIQRDLARFARDLAELIGEIIAENFQPQTLSEMSGFDLTAEPPPELVLKARTLIGQLQALQQPPAPPAEGAPGGAPGPAAPGAPPAPAGPDPRQLQAVQQQLQGVQQELAKFKLNADVLAILRDEKTRGFRIEIETDSTIEPDEQREKQARTEFLEAVGGFMQQAVQAVQTMPQLAPMMGEALLFLVRGFRVGRNMEDVIEKAMAQLSQASQQQRPDPAAAKAEAELKLKGQAHQQKMQQSDQQHQQAMQQRDQQHQQTLEQNERQFVQKQAADQAAQDRQLASDREAREADQSTRKAEGAAKMSLEREKAGLPASLEQQKAEFAQISQALSAAGEMVARLAEQLQQIEEHMAAPVEILRDKAGRVAGARKGNRTLTLKRGADGRASAMQ